VPPKTRPAPGPLPPAIQMPPGATLFKDPPAAKTPVPPASDSPVQAFSAPITNPLPISLTLVLDPERVLPGRLISATVSIVNRGPDPAPDLQLWALVPPAAHWLEGQPGNYDRTTRVMTTTLPLLPPGMNLTRTFTLRTVGLAPGGALTMPLALVRPGLGTVVTATAGVQVDNPPAERLIGPEGGELVSTDERIQVEIPRGTFTRPVQLVQNWDWQGESWRGYKDRFFHFSLTARDQVSGEEIHTLGAAITLTLRAGDWMLPGERLFMRHRRDAQSAWQAVGGALTPDPETGTVQIVLSHLSELQGSSSSPEKEGWKLLWNDATVGLFNGSASYVFPLEAPPGRHGVQPSLALTYNSSRANGHTNWIQSDWAGLGWSLDAVEITRAMGYGEQPGEDGDGNYGFNCNYNGDLCMSNDFTLLFHGTAYHLIRDGSSNFYHTEDESFLKIERKCTTQYSDPQQSNPCANDGASNDGGWARTASGNAYEYDYWEVTTQDGTLYRLGARADSEQRHGQVCRNFNAENCNPFPAVWRWRLDRVKDTYAANQMTYYYDETQAEDQGYTLGGDHLDEWDRESYLDYIDYVNPSGYPRYRIVFETTCRHEAPGTCETTETEDIEDAIGAGYGEENFVMWFQRKVLHDVQVRVYTASSTYTLVREYRFGYATSGDRTDENADGLPSRVLESIQMYGVYHESGWQSLPETTFAYEPLDSWKPECHQGTDPSFQYGHLSEIDNGYGGTIALEYDELEDSNCDDHWPYYYRVNTKTVSDGATPDQVTGYAYTWPCYQHGDSECRGYQAANGQSLTGFGKVVVTTHSGTLGGAVLAKSEHRFFPDDDDWNTTGPKDFGARAWGLVGREKLTKQLDSNGDVYAETQQVYTDTITVDRGDVNQPNAMFVHLDETIASTWTPSTLALRTRTATSYDMDYGLPVAQYSYGDTRVLSNGSFEQGMDGDAPVDWTRFDYTTGGGDFTVGLSTDHDKVVIGNASMTLTHNATGNCDCGVYQYAGIEGGTTYRVFVRVQAESTTAPNFKLLVSDLHGTVRETTTAVPGTDWEVLSVDIPAASNATALWIRPQLANGSAGVIDVDDVWYEPLSSTGDERMQTTSYVSNTANGHYLVGLPDNQRVYTGTAVLEDEINLASRVQMEYDDGGTLTHGALTTQWAFWDPMNSQHYYATTFDYDDDYGNRISVTDALGKTTTTTYDDDYHAYPYTIENALGHSTTLTYDPRFGKVTNVHDDENDVDTGLEYDDFGRLTKVIEDGDSTTYPTVQYDYADAYAYGGLTGLRVKTTRREVSGAAHASDVRVDYAFYTGRGLLVQTRSELTDTGNGTQAVANVSYDALGRALKTYTPKEYTTSDQYNGSQTSGVYAETTYDSLGRVTDQMATDETHTRIYYNGLATAVIDANHHQKISVVDAFGELVTVKEYTGTYTGDPNWTTTPYATTAYQYNILGSLTQVTDDFGRETKMYYDGLGRKVKMDDPSMGVWTYKYNGLGALTDQKDASNQHVCFFYDDIGRLKGKTYQGSTCPTTDPESYTESYYYDEEDHGYSYGQRTRAVNAGSSVSWTYDSRGRVIAETRTVADMGTGAGSGDSSYTFEYTYDTAGRVVTTKYPTGEVVTSAYNSAWQPAALSSPWREDSYIAEASYNARGQLTQLNHNSDGLLTTYTYWGDSTGETKSYRLKELTVGKSGQTALLDLYYGSGSTDGYDNVGNVTALTDNSNAGQLQTFGYDELDRLTSASTSAAGDGRYSHTYSYGTVGNLDTLAGRTYVYATNRTMAARYSYVLGGNDGRFDPFTSSTTGWTLCATYCALATESGSGEGVLRNGNGASGRTTLSGPATVDNLDSIQVEFRAAHYDGNSPQDTTFDMVLALEAPASPKGGGTQRFGVIATSGQALRVVERINGTDNYVDLSGFELEAGKWYVLRAYLGTNSSHPFQVYVWQRDDPANRRYYSEASIDAAWLGTTWHLVSEVNVSASHDTYVLLDSYFGLDADGTTPPSVYDYDYDANGNMLARTEQGVGYTQAWDEENRLSEVRYGGTSSTWDTYAFAYDADGVRVQQEAPDDAKTAYAGGGLYEETRAGAPSVDEDFSTDPDARWSIEKGTWGWLNQNAYRQTDSGGEDVSLYEPDTSEYGDVDVTADVTVGTGTNALAGIVVRRDDGSEGKQGYFVGLRNSSQGCGIYREVGGAWTNETPGLETCLVEPDTTVTLEARVVGGRIDMLVNGELIASWVDSSPLPAGDVGLATWNGQSTFDNVQVYGMSSRSYYRLGGAVVAVRTTSEDVTGSVAPVTNLHGDHLGSVSLATDTSGGLVTGSRALYLPFGDTRGTAPTGLPTDAGFVGGRTPPSLGLVGLGARWYDPKLGRWGSADTIVPSAANPQSLNRFAYVYNNPVRHSDPTGHCAKTDTTCLDKAKELYQVYGWYLDNIASWGIDEIQKLLDAGQKLAEWISLFGLNGDIAAAQGKIRTIWGGVTFYKNSTYIGEVNVLRSAEDKAVAITDADRITLIDGWEKLNDPVSLVLHELGHVLDNRTNMKLDGKWGSTYSDAGRWGGGLSDYLVERLGGDPSKCWMRANCGLGWDQRVGINEAPVSNYANRRGPSEDFAESFKLNVTGGLPLDSNHATFMNDVGNAIALQPSTPQNTGDPYAWYPGCWYCR
jgi:RHS repeat-associated protein